MAKCRWYKGDGEYVLARNKEEAARILGLNPHKTKNITKVVKHDTRHSKRSVGTRKKRA